jgi:hypothetical protein
VDWLTATLLGSSGGAIVEFISMWGYLTAWQKDRHDARDNKRPLPTITTYIDPLADGMVALTRLCMGGVAGLLFHGQVTGTMAAIAVGASAPALLRQIGTARGMRDLQAGQAEEIAGNPSLDVTRLSRKSDTATEAVE